MKTESAIRSLVGEIAESDLRFVECYPTEDFGVFIPSAGYCSYALKSNHTHPAYSFVISVGESDGILFEDAIAVDSNHYLAAVLSPGIPHRERTGESFCRYYALFVSESLFGKLADECHITVPVYEQWNQFRIPKGILVLLHRYVQEYGRAAPGTVLVLRMIGELITVDLIRALHGFHGENPITQDGVQKAIHHMHQHFSEELAIPNLARLGGLSTTSFQRKFKEQTGEAPGRYLLQVRLEKTKQLLRAASLSISEIAYQCGFSNPGHLATSFRKEMGVTPSEYRRKYDGPPL